MPHPFTSTLPFSKWLQCRVAWSQMTRRRRQKQGEEQVRFCFSFPLNGPVQPAGAGELLLGLVTGVMREHAVRLSGVARG